MNAPRIRPILISFVLAFPLFSGCATYRNATAYFNTYYNASHLFGQAVAELEKTPQPARDSNYFAAYKTPPGTIRKFESVIEKGSKLIQFHGESGFVEDAILMIGKSYLYQNETESAARKFRELLDNFPGSDERPEARLWYAKSLYMGKNDEEALVAVKELTASGQSQIEGVDVDDDLLLEGLMLEAQIYADRGESGTAAKTLARIGTLDGDSRLKAIAQYQLGTVYETTGAYLMAAAAYDLVSDFSPDPAMSFNAKLRKGVMLSRAGKPDQALESFDEIIAWPLKKEESARVDLEIANSYWDRGDSAAAFTLYGIIDSSYKKSDASARAYFTRGDIMQHHYLNLKKAKDFYSSARTEYPASPITAEAGRRFTSLDHYFKTQASLEKDESTLYALLHPDTSGSVTDSGGVAPLEPADSAGVTVAPDEEPADHQTTDPEKLRPVSGREVAQSIENLSMRALRSMPRHLVADPDEGVRSAAGDGESATGDIENALASRLEEGKTIPKGKDAGETKKPAGAVKAPPKEPLSADVLEAKIATGQYELGGVLFLDLDLPDSALVYYGRIVKDHPSSVLVPKALYAMSAVRRELGDTNAVDSLYDVLLAQYPRTEYTDQVRKNRGLDTTAATESAGLVRYGEAEAMLLNDDPDSALTVLKSLYATTTDSVIRPKACYAVGWIYENLHLNLDSADTWYKLLIREYPSSVYADNAEPRVAVKEDTSKLKTYVKFNEIKAIARPAKKNLGLVPREDAGGQGNALPAGVTKPGEDPDDEGYNPEEDQEPDDEPDPDDLEPTDPDDDPGDDDPGTGVLQSGMIQPPL